MLECVIDPMHNLLLGTAKHMIDTWKEIGILNKKNYDIQEKSRQLYFTS